MDILSNIQDYINTYYPSEELTQNIPEEIKPNKLEETTQNIPKEIKPNKLEETTQNIPKEIKPNKLEETTQNIFEKECNCSSESRRPVEEYDQHGYLHTYTCDKCGGKYKTTEY